MPVNLQLLAQLQVVLVPGAVSPPPQIGICVAPLLPVVGEFSQPLPLPPGAVSPPLRPDDELFPLPLAEAAVDITLPVAGVLPPHADTALAAVFGYLPL